MLWRKDRVEGGRIVGTPDFCWGRIGPNLTLREWYVSWRLFKRRRFFATGHYHRHTYRRGYRFHACREE